MASKAFLEFHEGWILEILLWSSLLIGIHYAVRRTIAYFRKHPGLKGACWYERLDQILHLPLRVLLWVVGSIFAINVVSTRLGLSEFVPFFTSLRNAAIVGCGAWAILRWMGQLQHALLSRVEPRAERKGADLGMVHLLGKIVAMAVMVICALAIMQIFGVNVAPLVAFGGIGAAAVGFAGKDVIANFFGGLMLHLTRPFTLGDMIFLPDRHIEGIVEQIGWYLTALRDREKRPVYLPNAIFSTMLVINLSRRSHRRIEERIGIRYHDFEKVPELLEAIRERICMHPSIDRSQPMVIAFDRMEAYTLGIYIDTYTITTHHEDFFTVKQQILSDVYRTILSHGAEIPLPTSAVHVQTTEVHV